jgi:hypothetical protein
MSLSTSNGIESLDSQDRSYMRGGLLKLKREGKSLGWQNVI